METKDDTKTCQLSAQDSGEYSGKCRSSLDTDGLHLSNIVMPPVPSLEETTMAEEQAE
ncbi:MAG: hypothetical protein ACI9KN_000167 [Gammaproteobacteria bacterium]|jgi:hypothetical protein